MAGKSARVGINLNWCSIMVVCMRVFAENHGVAITCIYLF